MNTPIENIDDLIGKHLSGEATAEEQSIVSAWLQQSEANQKYFNQLKTIFTQASSIADKQQYDTDAAWIKVKENLKKPAGKSRSINEVQTSSILIWRAAAIITIVLGIGWYYFMRSGSTSEVFQPIDVVAQKSARPDTLPNGSPVFLNKDTKLTYAFNPKQKTHTIDLKGEAYFEIKKDEEEKFIIESNGVYIRDIGTSFNVKAYPDSDIIEVLVEEGEVVFYTDEDPGVHLKASGKGVYNKRTKTFTIEEPESNILSYKTRLFVFSESNLGTVAEALNNVYQTKLKVPDHLKNCLLTVSFHDEPIEEISAVIAETLNLNVNHKDDTIHFDGVGCE